MEIAAGLLDRIVLQIRFVFRGATSGDENRFLQFFAHRRPVGIDPTDAAGAHRLTGAGFWTPFSTCCAGGIQWRLMPAGFPPWQTVYHVCRQWIRDHTWESINARLRALVRESAAKRCRPTGAVLDSQSIKSVPHGGTVGYDAAKRIKGRKRHLLVDTLGLLLGVEISAADVPEREGARYLLTDVLPWFNWLRKLWVDGGYSGDAFAQWVKTIRPKLEVEVVKRSDSTQGFEVLPKRWVVERSIGWLMRQRRLARDYETTEQSAAAFIFVAMIRIQLRRLA